jgi:hypothetical protein
MDVRNSVLPCPVHYYDYFIFSSHILRYVRYKFTVKIQIKLKHSYSETSKPCIEQEGLLPYSQESATDPYPEPAKSVRTTAKFKDSNFDT